MSTQGAVVTALGSQLTFRFWHLLASSGRLNKGRFVHWKWGENVSSWITAVCTRKWKRRIRTFYDSVSSGCAVEQRKFDAEPPEKTTNTMLTYHVHSSSNSHVLKLLFHKRFDMQSFQNDLDQLNHSLEPCAAKYEKLLEITGRNVLEWCSHNYSLNRLKFCLQPHHM